MYSVAVVKYERPFGSLKQAVELCGGFGDLSANSKVFIKPNSGMARRGQLSQVWRFDDQSAHRRHGQVAE